VFSLGKDKSYGNQQELLKSACDHFQELTDILSEVSQFPYVWCDFELLGGSRDGIRQISSIICN
jgi:hypothetical protein